MIQIQYIIMFHTKVLIIEYRIESAKEFAFHSIYYFHYIKKTCVNKSENEN